MTMAQEGHVYISGALDRPHKKLDLRVIVNTLKNKKINELTFVDPEVGIQKIVINQELVKGRIYEFSFPLHKVGSKSGWILNPPPDQNLILVSPLTIHHPQALENMPTSWKVINGKLVIPSGTYHIERDLNLQEYGPLEIKDVTLLMGKDVSIEVKGNVNFRNLTIKPKDPKNNWSNFVVLSHGRKGVWENVTVMGGKDDTKRSLFHSCSLCIYGGSHEFNKLSVLNSEAEDGLNIKDAKVFIKDSLFKNSLSDSFDCDWCQLEIIDSVFESSKGDAIDVSGNSGSAKRLKITESNDKGISIGENSRFTVSDCLISKVQTGVAVKDTSEVVVERTTFTQNKMDLAVYKKKHIWKSGKLGLIKNIFDKKKTQLDSQAVIYED